MLKKAIAAISTLDVALGALLAGAFVVQSARGEGPFWIMLLTGLALVAQGGYTLLYAWAWRPYQALSRPMTRLLAGGQLAALAVGNAAFLQGVLYNLHPRNGDHEFLPMTAGALMAAQAAAALGYLWLRERRGHLAA
ncbi:MAG TPA: hypothetical protein VKA84_01080 [Gemmatimonadaceae bacterium]|nr:hypothetical protein [Gemmatimonadaceae bacterium]